MSEMKSRMLCRRLWFWQINAFKASGWIIGYHTLWRRIRPVAVLRLSSPNHKE